MLFVGVAILGAAFCAVAAFAKAPNAVTRTATGVTAHSAALQGTVNPSDKPSTYSFDYGTSSAYGKVTTVTSLAKSKADVAVTAAVTDLQPSTTYHFRVVAVNSDGTTRGADLTFTTAADPLTPGAPSDAPGTTPGATSTTDAPAPPPPPILGKRVNVAPGSGTVLVRVPGAANAVRLASAGSVPVGTLVDTREGAVDLTAALPGGATQKAAVHGGLFQVRQPASGKGMTELVLRGPKPTCGARAAAVSGRRPPRKLWTSDHNGRFRTRGSNAVATVRGTSWYMADRCDGTYTRVKHGKVSVRELRTGRTVLLRAGQSHLARAAR
jgi:hypothetical protein